MSWIILQLASYLPHTDAFSYRLATTNTLCVDIREPISQHLFRYRP